jgi:hypothetical protein
MYMLWRGDAPILGIVSRRVNDKRAVFGRGSGIGLVPCADSWLVVGSWWFVVISSERRAHALACAIFGVSDHDQVKPPLCECRVRRPRRLRPAVCEVLRDGIAQTEACARHESLAWARSEESTQCRPADNESVGGCQPLTSCTCRAPRGRDSRATSAADRCRPAPTRSPPSSRCR